MDILETREFYMYCQNYRHAQDAIGEPNAAEAFEMLKRWIRENRDSIKTPAELSAITGQSDFT